LRAPAPAAVPVEIRVLDVGDRTERVFRLTYALGEEGLLLTKPLPWEARRPVQLVWRLPGEDAQIDCTGLIQEVRPEREDEDATPRAVAFVGLGEAERTRIRQYVQERMLLP
jgi:hypothetical protein